MARRETQEELTAQLQELDAEIAAHPLASEKVRAAHAVIDELGADDKEAVAERLAEMGLPGLEGLGRIQAKHTVSWWKLHRRRLKLLAKFDRING